MRTLLLFMTLLLLTACGQQGPSPGDGMVGQCTVEQLEADACPEVYQPVCGSDGETYSNECDACRAGIVEFTEGECGTDEAPDGAPERPDAYVACSEPRPEVCTREYRPVCAEKDTGVRCVAPPCEESRTWETYSNACTACSDEDVYGYIPGACEEAENDGNAERHVCTPEEQAAEICTMEYAPVCGSDGETYSNGCQACSAGIESYVPGEC